MSSADGLNLLFEPLLNLDANKTALKYFSGLYGYTIPARNGYF